MADEKFGIENLKAVLQFGLTLGKTLSTDLSDSNLTFPEILGLVAQLGQVSDFVKNKDAIIQEAKDLSVAEVAQLATLVEGGITNEKIVGTIENALNILVGVKNLIDIWSN